MGHRSPAGFVCPLLHVSIWRPPPWVFIDGLMIENHASLYDRVRYEQADRGN